MKFNVIFYFILVVLCWTLNPFIKKSVLKNDRITTDEYFIINHFVITLLFIGYFIYLYKNKKGSPNCIARIDRYDALYIILGAVTSILGARLLLAIIKQNDVSYMVAHIQPLVILMTFLIGYFFFTESINIYRIIGGGLVIVGIILLNKKSINK